MQSKKYIITGFIGLVAIAGMAFFMMKKHQLPTMIASPSIEQNLFSLAPKNFDQFIYIQSDKDLKDALKKYKNKALSGDFQALVQEIDEALVWKYTSGNDVKDLLFLQGSSLDIESLKQWGIIANEPGYEARKIKKDIWIYGAKTALDRYEKQDDHLLDDEQVKKYRDDFHAGGYNMGFFSHPHAVAGLAGLKQFVEKLQYVAVMTHLDSVHTKGKLTLQFDKGVIHGTDGGFEPRFEKYKNDDMIFSLELHDIMGFLGIEKEQFMQIAPLVFGQGGSAYANLLSSEDYENIYNSFHKNIAMIVDASSKSSGFVNLALFIQDKNLFSSLKKLSPFWKSTLTNFWGAGAIEDHTDEKGVQYILPIGSGNTAEKMQFLLAQYEDMTLISLSQLEKTWGVFSGNQTKNTDKIRNKNTVMTFLFDTKKLQNISSQLGGTPGGNNLWGQGIFEGNVEANKETGEVVVNFEMRKN